MVSPQNTPILEMTGITKRFPGVLANDNVNFTLKKGEIHALLGENGAGKSTLMKILYGLYQADSGTIKIDGKLENIREPNDALKLGIGMVHQHFMLIPQFTVVENLVLGSEPKRGGLFMDLNEATKKVLAVSEQYGLAIDPNAKIMNISVGMQQRVEILKALMRGADILVLDEPTAGLDPVIRREVLDLLYNVIQDEKKSIFFSTHITTDLEKIADYITYIKDGKLVFSKTMEEVVPESRIRLRALNLKAIDIGYNYED